MSRFRKRAACIFALVLLCYGGTTAEAQVAFRLGSSQVDDGRAIAIDDSGNTYVTGRFRLAVDFDPGPGTFTLTPTIGYARYIASYDATGGLRYAIKLDGASLPDAGIAVDGAGNVYVTSAFTGFVDFDPGGDEFLLSTVDGRIFVAGYDGSGNFRFAVNFGVNSGTTEYGAAIAVDASGNSVVTGAFTGETDFDPSPGELLIQANGVTDIFVAGFTPDGNLRFAVGAGGTGADQGLGIAIDGSGNSYVTGSFRDSVDFDPALGEQLLISNGGEDLFLASYADGGGFRYALSAGGTGNDRGNGVAVDDSGNAFLAGYFAGSADFDPGPGEVLLASSGDSDLVVASYDASGGLRFAHGFGNTNPDRGFGATVDALGGVHVTGNFRDTIDFDPGPGDASIGVLGTAGFVASYDGAGAYRNAYAFERVGTGSATGYGVAVDMAGRPHVIGTFTGTVDFDPGPATASLISAGSDEMFFSSFFPGVLGPGSVPAPSLTISRGAAAGNVALAWGASCSSAGVDYAVYEGQLGNWYTHTLKTCTDAGQDLREEIAPEAGDRYFLVVPLTAAAEGSYGDDGIGSARPVGLATCRASQSAESCP